jgi:NAD+ diphosphatase
MQGTMNHKGTFSAAFLQSRYPEPELMPADADRVIVRDHGVVVRNGERPTIFFPGKDLQEPAGWLRTQYLGHRGPAACYAVECVPETELPDTTYYPNVRELFGVIPDEELAVAALAARIIDFERNTCFCGRCGTRVEQSRSERARCCPACHLTVYPRISPAIIVLIRKGDRILLARSPRFPPDLHSVLAGFVEAGENLEDAVSREVREEVGIEVTNIRYFGSEPWPFPNSLMLGFTADYAGGVIVVDNNEILSAGWFDRDHLPRLPAPMSISRALIDRWIGQGNGAEP